MVMFRLDNIAFSWEGTSFGVIEPHLAIRLPVGGLQKGNTFPIPESDLREQ